MVAHGPMLVLLITLHGWIFAALALCTTFTSRRAWVAQVLARPMILILLNPLIVFPQHLL